MHPSISKALTFTVLAATLAACGDSASITEPGGPPRPPKVEVSIPNAAMALRSSTDTTQVASSTVTKLSEKLPVSSRVGFAKFRASRLSGYLVSSGRQ